MLPSHDSTPAGNVQLEVTADSSLSTQPAGEGTQVQRDVPTHLFSRTTLPLVPGYSVSREIARGGMGVVYAAHDPTFDREVAVKVMHPGQDAGRFVVESKVTAQLPHPGVPPVYALGTLPDGRPFLAMKLIRGHTLADELRASDLPRLLGVFEQICQTVGFAHSQGVIHRDLKPANVMVGAFGEVQVMDWGLAKSVVVGPEAGVSENVDGVVVTSGGATETVAGQVKGTPAYMAPEQARGEPVGPPADVFALGGILAAILTGKPPFLGDTVLDTVLMAAQAELGACFAQLDACGADPELVAVAKRCLAADADKRFATGQKVAGAVATYRAGVAERLRQAERDRAVSEAETREQRKRRKVQLALFGAVLLLVLGGGAVAWWQDKQETARKNERERDEVHRQADLRAADLKGQVELSAADANRRAELAAADAVAQEKQRAAKRQTRAGALVDALATADTAGVQGLIDDINEYRDLTGPKLRELASQPVATKPGLHGRLALLADEPGLAVELAAYLPVCKPEELLTIRQFLTPHSAAVSPGLWAVLTDVKAQAGKRVRAACALAGLTPDDPRWKTVAPAVADLVVKEENVLGWVFWAKALEPVRRELVVPLVMRYATAQGRIRFGKLDEFGLAEEAIAFDLTAILLVLYTADRPVELAVMAVNVEARHYASFASSIQKNKTEVVRLLKADVAKKPQVGWADAEIDTLEKCRGHAAAVLLTLGEVEFVWPVFAFPKDGDPSARSYLVERLAAIGADPVTLVRRFAVETDVSAKRALLIALGDFPAELVPAGEREPFVSRLLVLYRDDPDSGLHGAIDWLLRQKWRWGNGRELAVIDAELAAVARGRVAARGLAGAVPVPAVVGLVGSVVGPLLPAPAVSSGKDWFVNGEGQTYAVVRGPVEFTMGSPATESGRNGATEPAHRKRIGRSFAIATKEVTNAEFLRLRPDHFWIERYSPGRDTPTVSVSWYDCAAYCNWLSWREGIPKDQWCYEPNKDGKYAEGMTMKPGHLSLTGYRLPTEAEWEHACRAGSSVSRYSGRGEELLRRYGWYRKNAEERAWPVGQLRPNDLGLFDMLGNAQEWVEDPGLEYLTVRVDDKENSEFMSIDERMGRLLRGASFGAPPAYLRSTVRGNERPGKYDNSTGFRPTRTVLD